MGGGADLFDEVELSGLAVEGNDGGGPALRPAWTAVIPTPPVPSTRTLSVGWTWAALVTAPTAPAAEHVASTAAVKGKVRSAIATTLARSTTVRSANAPTRQKEPTSWPWASRRR
ncbi:hypothetical protein AQJ23_17025 [Streptomyces antibioticus]|nr:hypothetical protein AQJ23_17025 [Streptomyces antibioticus]